MMFGGTLGAVWLGFTQMSAIGVVAIEYSENNGIA
jgi:hypothetical protein